MNDLRLRTIKKASEETGASRGFFRKLLRQKKLKRYGINRSVYVSLFEFEQIASQDNSEKN